VNYRFNFASPLVARYGFKCNQELLKGARGVCASRANRHDFGARRLRIKASSRLVQDFIRQKKPSFPNRFGSRQV
jgi:hypothetical protein